MGMRNLKRAKGHMGRQAVDTARTVFFGGHASQRSVGSAIRDAPRPLVLVFMRLAGGGYAERRGSWAGGAPSSVPDGALRKPSADGSGGVGAGEPSRQVRMTDSNGYDNEGLLQRRAGEDAPPADVGEPTTQSMVDSNGFDNESLLLRNESWVRQVTGQSVDGQTSTEHLLGNYKALGKEDSSPEEKGACACCTVS